MSDSTHDDIVRMAKQLDKAAAGDDVSVRFFLFFFCGTFLKPLLNAECFFLCVSYFSFFVVVLMSQLF